jgi:hypothetical protein
MLSRDLTSQAIRLCENAHPLVGSRGRGLFAGAMLGSTGITAGSLTSSIGAHR